MKIRTKKKLKTIGVCLLLATFSIACGKTKEADTNNNAVDNKANNQVALVEANNTTNNKANDKKDDENKVEDGQEEISITEWEGSWNDMSAYLDDPALEDAFKIAGEKDGKTAEEAKAELMEKRKTDFAGFKVEGDKVTFLDNFEDKEGKEIASSEYKFTKSYDAQHGNKTLTWDAFEATSPDAKFPVLLMMPVHGEDTLTHFHMRYGDDVEALLEMEGWFPTYVKPSTTTEQLVQEITE